MSIQEQIDQYLALKQKERETRVRSGKFNPSMFGCCFRKQWFNRANEPVTNPHDPLTLRRFEAGKLFEEFVLSKLPKGEAQVLVEDEYFKGYADHVLEDEVREIKSQHSKSFWWMLKRLKAGESILDIKRENILQNSFYAIGLKKDTIHLVFVSRDDLAIDEKVIPVTPQIKALVESETKQLIALKSIPPAVPRAYGSSATNKTECEKYCGWKNKCWAMEGWE